MEKLFKTPPKTFEAKDRSRRSVILEHRMGKQGGSYTAEALMDRLGLEDEWADTCSKLEKKFRDRATFDKISDQVYRGERAKLSAAVKTFRSNLEKFYQTQGIRPLVAFVPVDDKHVGLFIQAFVDIETNELVQGDVSDAALWTETVAIRSKPIADLYKQSQTTAKRLLTRKDVNKDLVPRLEAVVSGELPKRIGYLKNEE